MPDHIIAVVTFPDTGKAFEAMGRLRSASDSDQLKVANAGIITRDPDGPITVLERQDAVLGRDVRDSGLNALVTGLLSGPLGLLLGWGAGALFGAYRPDESGSRAPDSALAALSRQLTPNTPAIIAEIEQSRPDALAACLDDDQAVIVQRAADDVLSEVEAADEAARAAQHEASRTLARARQIRREQSRVVSRQTWDERISALKTKVMA